MECREHEALLQPFFDGELDEATAVKVAETLESCPACQARLAWLEVMHEGIRAPIEAELTRVSFDGLWEGIESKLDGPRLVTALPSASASPAPDAPVRPASPEQQPWLQHVFGGMFDRLSWGPLFAMAGAAAAVAVGFALWGSKENVQPGGTPGSTGTIAGMSGDASGTDENNLAFVSSIEVGSGFVIIDQVPSDPSQPLIVWHVEDGGEVEVEPEGSKGG